MFRLKNKVIQNASWIIACRVIQALLGFVIFILMARYLGPSNYGLINYAASVVAFVIPVMQLGLNNILVQEIVNEPEREGEILGTALCMSFVSSLLCMAGVISFALIANRGETDTIIVMALYSTLLVCQSFELIQYWFQAKLLSKYTSVAMLAAYFVMSAYRIYLLVTGKSVFWFAVSSTLDYFIMAAAYLLTYKRLGQQPLKVSWEIASRLFGKGKYYILSNMMMTVFAQTDNIMLKFMGNSAATGYYSAAITCAGLTDFVFAAIIDSARPSILESKKSSREAYEHNLSRLYAVIIYLSLFQCLFMTLLAKPIVGILFGSEYEPSVMALQIVVWYNIFSYMGAVRNIWMLSEGKQSHLWKINLAGAFANVALNLVLIPPYGIYGAAVASLITQFFTNVVVSCILKPTRGNNRLMLRGTDPRLLVEILRDAMK